MISIIIPTYNAGLLLHNLLDRLYSQTFRYFEVIVIDSSSMDKTKHVAKRYGVKIINISKNEFDHGGTRTKAGKIAKGDILVYLTQDALPYNEYAIENLVKPFYEDEEIGATFGRQLPYPDATLFAKHLRFFNYPARSYIRSIRDKGKYGLKTCFCSNSFAAYRKSILEEVGWFKNGLIVSEDSYVVAKMLLKGYKVAYIAEAMVYHSHNYTVFQEFKRYFDIGVFHKREHWLIDVFGKATGEGKKYVMSELKFIINSNCYHLLPEFLVRNFLKFIGYKLGYNYNLLPKALIKRLSMHSTWWDRR